MRYGGFPCRYGGCDVRFSVERGDLPAQDVALAGSAAIESANDPVGEIVDVHEIQSQVLERAIAQPALRECAEFAPTAEWSFGPYTWPGWTITIGAPLFAASI